MTLNFSHVAQINQLPGEQVDALALPLVERLRALSCPSDRDALGIPHRARPVYEEALKHQPAVTIAALRRYLLEHRAAWSVIEACESITVV